MLCVSFKIDLRIAMLQEPRESEYDIRFQVLGFPVRISWTFWLGAIVIGFSFVQGVEGVLGPESPGRAPLFILWAVAIFTSILIHELGHALAFRQYGIQSSIVLYHFGGLAIPIGSFLPGRSIGRLHPRQDLWISFAGPLAQILSAVVVIGLIKMQSLRCDAFAFMPFGMHKVPGMLDGEPIENAALYALAVFYIVPSILWALLNLLPVLPMDGGRIAESLIVLNGGTRIQALWLSVITSGVMCAYAFTNHQTFLGIFFLMFGVSAYQQLQGPSGWR